MITKYETIEFQKDKYEEEWQMWEDITVFIKALLRNEYQIKIWEDEECVIIDYCHNLQLSNVLLEFVEAEELSDIMPNVVE